MLSQNPGGLNPIYQLNSCCVLKYLAEKGCSLKKPVVPILSFGLSHFYQMLGTFQINYFANSVNVRFVCLHFNIVIRHCPIKKIMPHFYGNSWRNKKIIFEIGWSNSAFFRPHLKNCYCDKRYLGKWVGDPLKIVQNESVKKKNTC